MHEKTEDQDRTAYAEALQEVRELRELVETGFTAMQLSIDHLAGKHDFARVAGCPSCEVLRAA